jgi:hypothetical protein
MKIFFKQLVLALTVFFIILVLLDLVYTHIYKHPVHERSKVSWLMNKKPNQQFDYAIFGSSRVFFHLNPEQIKSETGLNGINLGYPGSNNFEIKLMVKEFLKQQKTEKIFIQVDEQYNKEHFDPIAIIPWMPFIKNETIFNEIKTVDSAAVYKKYVPFYRYMLYDSKLGFREIMMSFINANQFESTNGFASPNGVMRGKIELQVKKLYNKNNKHLEAIINICKKEDIDLYFFTAPYYKTDINTDVLAEQLTNYYDFSDIFKDMDYFGDSSHLSKKGAEEFTHLFVRTYFKN